MRSARRRAAAPAAVHAQDEPRSSPAAAAAPRDDEGDRGPHAWRKVLYLRQPFPDNYTDNSFLSELVLNRNTVRASTVVTQQLDVTLSAAAVFHSLHAGALQPRTLLLLTGALLAGGAALRAACSGGGGGGAVRRSAREGALLVGGVRLLSPLFATLTGSISGDTIAFLVASSLLLHLFLHDYSAGARPVAGSVSIGLAVFASVLLASRLPSVQHVFALIMFALEVFLLSPLVRRDVARASWRAHAALTAALHAATHAALWRIRPFLAAVHAGALLFIALVCPYCLVSIQRLKRRINGPWDEARPPARHAPAGHDAGERPPYYA